MTADASEDDDEDDFDRARKQHFASDSTGGWKAELNRYLQDPAIDVTKDEDTVQWWEVSHTFIRLLHKYTIGYIHSVMDKSILPSHELLLMFCRSRQLVYHASSFSRVWAAFRQTVAHVSAPTSSNGSRC